MHGDLSSLMEQQPLKQNLWSMLKWKDSNASPGKTTHFFLKSYILDPQDLDP